MFDAFMHGNVLRTYRAGLNFFPLQVRYAFCEGSTNSPPGDSPTTLAVWLTTTSM